MLLFVHVLLHPLVHAVGASERQVTSPVSASSTQSDGSLNAGDQCELCRVGHSTIVTPQLPKRDAESEVDSTALHAVNYASLQADHRLPSRAPPSL